MKPTLAIVGASTRAAAASALRAGFRPITADLFADEDLRAIATTTRISPYPDGFLDWLRAMDAPAWMYTGALENHPELVDQMAWIAPLWGNPGDVLTRVRSPRELATALHSTGLLFPETRESADGLPLDGSWLVKTYQGASGSGVREWPRLPLAEHEAELQPSPPQYYQRRIAGDPAAAAFVAAEGRAVLLGITRQLIGEPWLGAHGFQFCGSIGPLLVSDPVRDTVFRIGNVLAAEFELAGLFGIDMILTADQVWTIEVNPRYTASVEIVERIHQIRAIDLHAAAFQSPESPFATAGTKLFEFTTNAASRTAHGKATLFAKREVQLSHKFSQIILAEALHASFPNLADVSPAGTVVEAGRPILTLFAQGQSVVEVEERLRDRVAELEYQLYGESIP